LDQNFLTLQEIPVLNAVLNSMAFLFLLGGFIAIKNGKQFTHVMCMCSALVFSTLFLTFYLIYHFQVGSIGFKGEGSVRVIYFFILITHTILAIVNLPLVVMTFTRAFQNHWESHKKWARVTFPIWAYVSLTGVLVYFMLYQWFPAKVL